MAKTANALRNIEPFARLRRARHANLTCALESIPISTKIAIAAAPWIFIAQVFALVSKSPGDAAVIPICPCHAAQKKQRQHGVEKISLQALQSNRVRSRVSHGE